MRSSRSETPAVLRASRTTSAAGSTQSRWHVVRTGAARTPLPRAYSARKHLRWRYVIQRLDKPVVRKINNQPTKMYEGKREGHRDHTVEPRSTLLLDVPHLVKRFERQHGVEWRGGNKQPKWTK